MQRLDQWTLNICQDTVLAGKYTRLIAKTGRRPVSAQKLLRELGINFKNSDALLNLKLKADAPGFMP